ncbi:MAG TPA: hypothetical protein VGH27_12265 [Streptosporangiaceae bacterium]|jgi:hypothetical protein
MTDLDLAARRIRDAFDHDLAGYHAPSGLPERARLGGLRRSRQRRARRAAAVTAISCTAAAAGVAASTLMGGPSHARSGPQANPAAASPPSLPAAKPAAGMPSAATVGKTMLTSISTASSDILYETKSIGPGEMQVWSWPAQPVPGQQVRLRVRWTQPATRTGKAGFEDWAEEYTYPLHPPAPHDGITTSMQLTMACYMPPNAGCGYGPTTTLSHTWSRASYRGSPEQSDVSAGGSYNPVVLAQGLAHGQWRVAGRTRLDGQPVIELSETASGPISPRPQDVWVNARTGLALRYDGSGGYGTFGYLPPTAHNLALLQVPIPHGFPRSNPFSK